LSSLLPRALIALRQRSVLHGYALEGWKFNYFYSTLLIFVSCFKQDIGRARGAALGHSFALALTVI